MQSLNCNKTIFESISEYLYFKKNLALIPVTCPFSYAYDTITTSQADTKDRENPASPEEMSELDPEKHIGNMMYSANSTPDKKNRSARNNAFKEAKPETTKVLARANEFSTLTKNQFNRNQLNIIGLLG